MKFDAWPAGALRGARGFGLGGLLAFLGTPLISHLLPIPSNFVSGVALAVNGLVAGASVGSRWSTVGFGSAFLVAGLWTGFGLTPVGVFLKDWFLGFLLVGLMGSAIRCLEDSGRGRWAPWTVIAGGICGFVGGALLTGLLGWVQLVIYPALSRQIVLMAAYVLPQVIGGAVLGSVVAEDSD